MRLNDPIVIGNGYLMATGLKKEGMDLFAVIYIDDVSKRTVLRTAMSEPIILTMLYDEYYKLREKETKHGEHTSDR